MDYCMHCMNPIENNDSVCSFCGRKNDMEIPAHHLKPGTILNKKILVGRALGEGGFGITYIGRDIKLDIKVAIKEYYPNGYVNRSNTVSPEVTCSISEDRKAFFEKGCERFLKEAQILAKFAGEQGIVDVRDFFEENGTAYIVMEYLEGKDLKTYLKENGTLSPEKTIEMMRPIMNSLVKVHSQGLIHRDISPDNIRITESGVKLIDFGAARDVSSMANKSLSVMLKPGYAPEEQYRSKGNQGAWTDVYALCATMYKCITGITPDDSMERVINDELKAPSALGIMINPVIENALMKGLRVLQKDRYQSVQELLNGFKGLEAVSDGEEKTVYVAREIEDDDTETQYINNKVAQPVSEDDIRTVYSGVTATPEAVSQQVVQPVRTEQPQQVVQPVRVEQPQQVVQPVRVEQPQQVIQQVRTEQPQQIIQPVQVAQPQSQPKKSSKLPVIIGIVATVAIIAVIILCIALAGNDDSEKSTGGDTQKTTAGNSSENSSTGENDIENDTQNSTEDGGETDTTEDLTKLEVSDDLYDYTFELEGVVYKLPCEYSVLKENGWTIYNASVTEEDYLVSDTGVSVTMTNDSNKIIMIYLYNLSGDAKMLKDAMVGGITVGYFSDSYCEYYDVENVEFSMAKGITLKSTEEDILAAFGVPNEREDGTDAVSLQYIEKQSEEEGVTSAVTFEINTSEDADVNAAIAIGNIIETDADKTETNEAVPDYLSIYTAPTEVGNDLTTGTFMLDGALYELPVPVSEFLANGWTIKQKPSYIVCNGEGEITVEKDGVKLTLEIINFAKYQTIAENCVVTSITVDDTDGVDITLPGGLTFESSKADVDSVITEDFYYSEGNYRYYYSFTDYSEREFSIYLYVDKETGKLQEIEISCENIVFE